MINVKCIVTNFMREIIVLMNTLTATCENCESKISIVTIDIQCNVLFFTGPASIKGFSEWNK